MGRLRASNLLQRHDHSANHQRNEPVEMQTDQSCVGYRANRNRLTPRFRYGREVKRGVISKGLFTPTAGAKVTYIIGMDRVPG